MLELVDDVQLLDLETGLLFQVAALGLGFIESLKKTHDRSREVLLLQADLARVKEVLKRYELTFKLITDFEASVGSGRLVGRAGSNIGTDIVDLLTNIAVKLRILTAE